YSRILVIATNFTDDYPTELSIPPVTVKEQAIGIEVANFARLKEEYAKDKDCGTTIQFQLSEDDATVTYFDIGQGPTVTTKKALDYETQKQHTINFTVTSALPSSNEPTYIYGQLVIDVEDVDDRDPVFSSDVYHLQLSESDDITQRVATGPMVLAQDGDTGINASLMYSVKSSEPPLNANISDNGELLVQGPLDRETVVAYKIIVKAQQVDNPSASATATVSLTITDVNDNVPAFDPQQQQSASILEDASPGTHVIWLVAKDPDEGENAEFVYTIHDNSGAFELRSNPVTRLTELVVKDANLFKGLNSTEVQIRLIEKVPVVGDEACDFSTSCGLNITVTVEDVNDNTPAFSQARYPIIIHDDQKSGREIGMIKAVDNDRGKNAEIQYSLAKISGDGSPDCDKVQVDASTGELSTNQGMLAGVTCLYTASACDSAVQVSDRRCSTAVVIVTVNKSQLNNGSIDVIKYDARIHEGLDVGTFVMTLPTADLISNDTNFVITGKNLETATVLDREEQDTYIVSAIRRNGTQDVEVLRITVHVENVNDNSPVFLRDNYAIFLMNGDEAGLNVLNIS
ncbi:hypothetical protein EGW08_006063, partial [Elysia chlorotica]